MRWKLGWGRGTAYGYALFLARLQQGTAAQLKEFLATRHGLLIRDASNFEGLDARYFRIAITDGRRKQSIN